MPTRKSRVSSISDMTKAEKAYFYSVRVLIGVGFVLAISIGVNIGFPDEATNASFTGMNTAVSLLKALDRPFLVLTVLSALATGFSRVLRG
jgi:hypothetical protein